MHTQNIIIRIPHIFNAEFFPPKALSTPVVVRRFQRTEDSPWKRKIDKLLKNIAKASFRSPVHQHTIHSPPENPSPLFPFQYNFITSLCRAEKDGIYENFHGQSTSMVSTPTRRHPQGHDNTADTIVRPYLESQQSQL